MLDCIYIVHRESGRLLLEKKFEEVQIDPDLFSGLLEAIRNFTRDIHVGMLTSFSTHDKQVLISLTESVVVALIMHIEASAEKWQGIAYEIGHQFSQSYDLTQWDGNRKTFNSFGEKIDSILNNQKDAFVVEVAKWAAQEFGGHIHIDQQLISYSYGGIPIDIVIDRGELKDLHTREQILSKFYKGYNHDIVFFRVIDGTMGLEEIEQFIETCKDFGYECHNKERCELYFDYFPSKIIIIAREFSPVALSQAHEFMLEDKKLKKHYILSNHLKHIRPLSLHGRGTKLFNCYIELWQWKSQRPERVFS